MTPIDFVHFSGDSEPNAPVHALYSALNNPLRVVSGGRQFEVCSYYMDGTQMVLEIEEKVND